MIQTRPARPPRSRRATDAVSPWPRPGRESSIRTRGPGAAGAPRAARARAARRRRGASPRRRRSPSPTRSAPRPARGCRARRRRRDAAARSRPYSSPMFMPPVKAMRRSTTRILRWSRKGWQQQVGEERVEEADLDALPPHLATRSLLRVAKDPRTSASTRTVTPRALALGQRLEEALGRSCRPSGCRTRAGSPTGRPRSPGTWAKASWPRKKTRTRLPARNRALVDAVEQLRETRVAQAFGQLRGQASHVLGAQCPRQAASLARDRAGDATGGESSGRRQRCPRATAPGPRGESGRRVRRRDERAEGSRRGFFGGATSIDDAPRRGRRAAAHTDARVDDDGALLEDLHRIQVHLPHLRDRSRAARRPAQNLPQGGLVGARRAPQAAQARRAANFLEHRRGVGIGQRGKAERDVGLELDERAAASRRGPAGRRWDRRSLRRSLRRRRRPASGRAPRTWRGRAAPASRGSASRRSPRRRQVQPNAADFGLVQDRPGRPPSERREARAPVRPAAASAAERAMQRGAAGIPTADSNLWFSGGASHPPPRRSAARARPRDGPGPRRQTGADGRAAPGASVPNGPRGRARRRRAPETGSSGSGPRAGGTPSSPRNVATIGLVGVATPLVRSPGPPPRSRSRGEE